MPPLTFPHTHTHTLAAGELGLCHGLAAEIPPSLQQQAGALPRREEEAEEGEEGFITPRQMGVSWGGGAAPPLGGGGGGGGGLCHTQADGGELRGHVCIMTLAAVCIHVSSGITTSF